MKVGIIGGGAIGLFFAASLSEWFPVTLFTRTKEQADMINKCGITIEEQGETTIHFIEAIPIAELPRYTPECLFIAVKQYKLPAILSMLEKLGSYPALVFLQNGMSHITSLGTLPHSHVYVAAVEHGVLKCGSGHVDVRGRGKTNLAVYRGKRQKIEAITERTKKSFPFEWRLDYERMLLGKMAANVVINPLTAILRVTNGELVSNPHYLKIAETVYKEFFTIFGDKMNAESWHEIIHICQTTAANRSSMLKDVEFKRPTEVDAILGHVLSEAAEKGIHLPVLESLYHMVKGLEDGWEE
ncbi:MAG TPA: 2-dehydropantoate 2-reductase [Pseudobacillus sp.]